MRKNGTRFNLPDLLLLRSEAEQLLDALLIYSRNLALCISWVLQMHRTLGHEGLSCAGVLHPLLIPAYHWSNYVSMDFITQLPNAARGIDAIVMFVDMLTKLVHLAACKTAVSAAETATLFETHVFKHHGFLLLSYHI
ncbi:hypothetical protein CEUSTIGMA_g4720.t1 [Chlamydomonas eustigma]|uniref:Integrase catalytic domain-containing protein n=1 Tax=Chlamydomonas eustigma TaxID=1157962 RepID=A0A250X2F0_9CHLO|nr:hypothetical protein CEUSTIGMA_g4720.t1 [Chlamydomonas eustigma]|eukprot:GAX77274.1 hypothetical protein CEUSTIGMA_g4720.t1 [Chlamydomonas eustigma]